MRLRGTDIIWLVFLGALGALGMMRENHSIFEWLALIALGAVQIAERPLGAYDSQRRALISVAVRLALCYLLVDVTGGIQENSYYLIFLLPIVSAASMFNLGYALIITAASSTLYLSFLVYILETYYVPPEGQRELAVRVLFFFISAVLVNRLSAENRLRTEQLAQANRDLQKAQDEVRRSERLAALGQLSAGLAHEIRNPLGIISASAELLRNNVSEENEVAREVSGFIGTEVKRTNQLVTRFLEFAGPAKLDLGKGDINDTIRAAIDHFREAPRGESAEIELNQELGQIPEFAHDKTLMESVFLNLLLNARDAMVGGGIIQVSTHRDGEQAIIEVADAGSGIPEDKMQDIFNPFFTTKASGVGLGLAMVAKIVDSHGGTVSVENRPNNHGALFRIQVPMDLEPQRTAGNF